MRNFFPFIYLTYFIEIQSFTDLILRLEKSLDNKNEKSFSNASKEPSSSSSTYQKSKKEGEL